MKKLSLVLGLAFLTVFTVVGVADEELTWCELEGETSEEEEVMAVCTPYPSCCGAYAQAAIQQCYAWYNSNAQAVCAAQYQYMISQHTAYCVQIAYSMIPPECYSWPSGCQPYIDQFIQQCIANFGPFIIENCIWDYVNNVAPIACNNAGVDAYNSCMSGQ